MANDTLDRLELLTSAFDRASAEAEAIGQHVQERLAAEEAQYQIDEALRPRKHSKR